MRRNPGLFVVIALLCTSTAARCEWYGVRWGMSMRQAKAASKIPLTIDRELPNRFYRFKVKLGDTEYQGHMDFLDGTLSDIVLWTEKAVDCAPTRNLFRQQYGRTVLRSRYDQTYEENTLTPVYLDRKNAVEATVIQDRQGNGACTVVIEPAKARSR